MYQKLYPKDSYPQGHPDLATSLNNLGFLLQAQGEYGKAEPFFRQALAMYQKLYPKEKYPAGPPRPGPQPQQPGRPARRPRGSTARPSPSSARPCEMYTQQASRLARLAPEAVPSTPPLPSP